MTRGMGDILGKAQQLQAKMHEVQEGLRDLFVEGLAGGGLVRAVMNGRQELTRIALDPEAVDPDDRELLEDLIVAAVADARTKSEELAREKMSQAAADLGIPPALARQMMGGAAG